MLNTADRTPATTQPLAKIVRTGTCRLFQRRRRASRWSIAVNMERMTPSNGGWAVPLCRTPFFPARRANVGVFGTMCPTQIGCARCKAGLRQLDHLQRSRCKLVQQPNAGQGVLGSDNSPAGSKDHDEAADFAVPKWWMLPPAAKRPFPPHPMIVKPAAFAPGSSPADPAHRESTF